MKKFDICTGEKVDDDSAKLKGVIKELEDEACHLWCIIRDVCYNDTARGRIVNYMVIMGEHFSQHVNKRLMRMVRQCGTSEHEIQTWKERTCLTDYPTKPGSY